MKFKNVMAAKQAAKKYYGNNCIVTGMSGIILDGCHIYPAGSYPQIKSYSENIVPCNRLFHNNILDYTNGLINSPQRRKEILLETVRPEFKSRLVQQLIELE